MTSLSDSYALHGALLALHGDARSAALALSHAWEEGRTEGKGLDWLACLNKASCDCWEAAEKERRHA